jgi:hypothetical protein
MKINKKYHCSNFFLCQNLKSRVSFIQLKTILDILNFFIFLIGTVGGGVQLGSHGTAANNRSIVPAPGDYDDGEIGGMMIGTGNRTIRKKHVPVSLLSTTNPTS